MKLVSIVSLGYPTVKTAVRCHYSDAGYSDCRALGHHRPTQ